MLSTAFGAFKAFFSRLKFSFVAPRAKGDTNPRIGDMRRRFYKLLPVAAAWFAFPRIAFAVDFGIIKALKKFIRESLQGFIVTQLQGVSENFQGQVTQASQALSATPQSWSAQVFQFVQNINQTAIIPIAGIIITAIACLEIIHSVTEKNNMNQGDSFELYKIILKMALSVVLVTHAFDFCSAIFDVAGSIVSRVSGATVGAFPASALNSVATQVMGTEEIGTLMAIAASVAIFRLAMMATGIIIQFAVISRIVEIYLYSSVAALPFSTLTHREWGTIGKNYIRGLASLGLQAVLIMVVLGIQGALWAKLTPSGNIDSVFLNLTLGALVTAGMILKCGTLAKSIMNAS